MPVIKEDPGTEIAITLGMDGVASGGARNGALVDTTTGTLGGLTAPLADCLLTGLFQTATGTLGTNPTVDVYVAVPATGTRYSDNVPSTGAASFTMLGTPGLYLVRKVAIDTAGTAKDMGQVSLAAALGFTPAKWIPVVVNNTGLAMGGTGNADTVNKLSYWPMQWQSV